MKARITEIDMDNAAFVPPEGDRGMELARILRALADKVESGVEVGDEFKLMDINGNSVGKLEIVGDN